MKETIARETNLGGSYASVAAGNLKTNSRGSVDSRGSSKPIPVISTESSDRKFNLIVRGLAESKKGTPRHERTRQDLAAVCDILTSLESDVSAASIRDCFRLGKYEPGRDRPALVKFIRSTDVSSVLSDTKKLATLAGVSVKPDKSLEERKVESLLLKERRSLIDKGVDRADIKIKGNSILVNKVRHGQVVNFNFQNNHQSRILWSIMTYPNNATIPTKQPMLLPCLQATPSAQLPLPTATQPKQDQRPEYLFIKPYLRTIVH